MSALSIFHLIPALPKEIQAQIFKKACVMSPSSYKLEKHPVSHLIVDPTMFERECTEYSCTSKDGGCFNSGGCKHFDTSLILSKLLISAKKSTNEGWIFRDLPKKLTNAVNGLFYRIGEYDSFKNRQSLLGTSVLARQIALEAFREDIQAIPIITFPPRRRPNVITPEQQEAQKEKLLRYLGHHIAELSKSWDGGKAVLADDTDVRALTTSLANLRIDKNEGKRVYGSASQEGSIRKLKRATTS